MSLAAVQNRRFTEVEYLEMERAAEFKSEFFDGEIFAMAGGTPNHSLIATMLGREFGNKLQISDCLPYNSDLKIKVLATGLITYPDLSVICGPPDLAPATTDVATNPTLLVEVLSESSEGYDRGAKFRNYSKISTLREYLLVSQWEPVIERFLRQDDGKWLWSETRGLEATLELSSLEITISLAAVFGKVKFEPRRKELTPAP